ncbi:MAG: PAS domain S-box protein, partial [Sneathiella sp.]|nr:PAS domain S-box protein [Sneathiella sp.]
MSKLKINNSLPRSTGFDQQPQNPFDTHTIISLINDPAFVIDLEGNIQTANTPGRALFPHHINHGLSLFSLVDADSQEKLKTNLESIIDGQILIVNAIHGKTEEGYPFQAEFHCLQLRDSIIVTARINRTPEADFSANFGHDRRNDKLLEAIPAPVFCKNTDHIYMACNSEFLKFLGLSRSEVIGKNVFEVAPTKNAEIYKKADEVLFKSGGKQVYETQVRYADGTMHDVVFHKSVFTDGFGKAAGIIGIILDITSRKKAERRAQESEALFQAI